MVFERAPEVMCQALIGLACTSDFSFGRAAMRFYILINSKNNFLKRQIGRFICKNIAPSCPALALYDTCAA